MARSLENNDSMDRRLNGSSLGGGSQTAVSG
jgi:hypothetical protein